MGLKAVLLGSVVTLFAGGCEPSPIFLRFIFQTDLHFRYSETADVAMVRARDGQTLNCSDVLKWATNNIGSFEAEEEFRGLSVCDLRDGAVTFNDIGEHERAFVAVIRGRYDRLLLTGCALKMTSLDLESIDLYVYPTREYGNYVDEIGELTCSNAEEKCSRGCR